MASAVGVVQEAGSGLAFFWENGECGMQNAERLQGIIAAKKRKKSRKECLGE
jgi:hypothetical protein